MKKTKLINKIKKFNYKTWIIPVIYALLNKSQVFATQATIGTKEVSTLTDNVKEAVVSLAMPIRRNIDICLDRINSI